MFGILVVNKPLHWTSCDAVNRIERIVRPSKAGHAGTLDPLATGVLVVCIGQATRLIKYVQRMPKRYEATFLLGRTSASDDLETPTAELPFAPQPALAEIQARLPQFVGAIAQRPPTYSAIKVDGRRAYKAARRGQEVDLQPRTIQIYDLAITHYEYPSLGLRIECGSGAYVRALGRDLAESLATGAVMSALVRTRIGDFSLSDAVNPDAITADAIRTHLRSPLAAVAELPLVRLTDAELHAVRQGQMISTALMSPEPAAAAVDANGQLVAILKKTADGRFKPSPNFSQFD